MADPIVTPQVLETPFVNFAFKATGATTARTMPDRLAEIVDVTDFGANPASSDNHDALQLAFDVAFGSNVPGTTGPDGAALYPPHGANSQLNKPVYFPPGNYTYHGSLNLTAAVGGLIYGDGPGMVSLRHYDSPGLNIQGCVGMTFRGFGLNGGGISQSNGITGVRLNYDNSTAQVGLRDILWNDVYFGGCNYGIRIAEAGFGGKNITFLACSISQSGVGMTIEGVDCLINGSGLTLSENWIGANIIKGSMINSGLSNSGSDPNGDGGTPRQVDYKMDSTGMLLIYGGRSESSYLADVNAGKLIAVGILHQPGRIHGRSISVAAGASANIIGCDFGSGGYTADTDGFITGAGNVFIKNLANRYGLPINLSGFTGKICQYAGVSTFTIAQLPPAVDGLLLPITNSNTSSWGADIGPTTGSAKVLGRYNAVTGKWTVVGI